MPFPCRRAFEPPAGISWHRGVTMLAIRALGAVTIERDGEPVTELNTRKIEALLIYLACTRRPHAREVLAEMFWEERTGERALGNLRVALSNLRKHAGDYLLIDRTTAAIDPQADVWLDVTALEKALAAGRLGQALELYRGDFLEGFYVRDCPGFEDWSTFERERLRRLAQDALRDLAEDALERGDYRAGIHFASRLLDMDPLLEDAHRQLMRLLAADGQRGAALNQYETCRQVLDEELGVEPEDETTALYQAIQAGELSVPVPAPRRPAGEPTPAPARLPAFLDREAAEPPRPVFVARERELARLSHFLQGALAGHSGVVLITGEPGQGKTTLLNEFGRRALDAHPRLLVGSGTCSAYSSVGDPYLPFRDVVATLTGDVEARWAAGALSREHARRAWQALPTAVEVLLDHGPDLFGAFVNAPALLSRAAAAAPGGAPWLERLADQAARPPAPAGDLARSHLFDQVTRTLDSLAREHPLLLLIDDLQWADQASIGLLFHLGRRLAQAGSRVLLVGAYRPEEVAAAAQGRRPPLLKVLSEFKRQFGDVSIDLDRAGEAEGRRFVDALLDTQPNRLSGAFRQALFHHTAGHPLFTVELLRAMQERGDLVRDADGSWLQGPNLDWQALPPRVEGVVEERIGRLDPTSRDLLALAAVQGQRFTAQVLARVKGIDERQLAQRLGRDLQQRHRLVAEDGVESLDGRRLHHFRFQHVLFRQYLYAHLGDLERELLHGEVAAALEDLYAGRTAEMAVELAGHWLHAADEERALPYLLKAGDQARAVYAHAEAEGFYRQAVVILRHRGRSELAARTLMKLGLVYTAAFQATEAQKAYEEAFALWPPRASRPAAPPAGAVLRLALEAPSTLDPGWVGDDVSAFVAAQLFEGLVRIGEDHNVLPAAARRWEIAADGCRYLFYLREGLRWSDGAPLTTGDFAYAWKRNLDPATGSPVAHLLDPIRNARAFREGRLGDADRVGVTALDDLTLEVRLESPTAYLPYLLALPIAYPLPRHAVEGHGSDWMQAGTPVTNGAYVLSSWTPGKGMVLTRNPHYQGALPGNVERVECSCRASYERALAAYAREEIDVVSLLNADPGTVARARAAYGDELIFFPRLVTFYLLFRADRPPFDDARVRRALAHALDREALARYAFQDQRLPATGGFVPPGMAGHSPGIGLAYDPERARCLLAAAGYPHGQGFPHVTWIHAQRSEDERIVSFLRASWREHLALDLPAASAAWETFLDRVEHDPADVTLIGWGADYPDPDFMLRVPFHSQTGATAAGWKNDRFDELVETAASTTDHARRMALYQEADRILVAEEAAVVPLSYGRGRMLARPWVSLPPTLSVRMPLQNVVVQRG
jgi:ABC-type oligopeptide transport system substrate-binding subunit/DNA-binding SARP family transcriptional activator